MIVYYWIKLILCFCKMLGNETTMLKEKSKKWELELTSWYNYIINECMIYAKIN